MFLLPFTLLAKSKGVEDMPHHLTVPAFLMVFVFKQPKMIPGLMSPGADISLVQLEQLFYRQTLSPGP